MLLWLSVSVSTGISPPPAWEQGVRENRWPESTKFNARIQVLSFGDGTGYFGTELYPPARRPRAAAKDKNLLNPPKVRASD
jgi:hypothetical protein